MSTRPWALEQKGLSLGGPVVFFPLMRTHGDSPMSDNVKLLHGWFMLQSRETGTSVYVPFMPSYVMSYIATAFLVVATQLWAPLQ